jgi:Tfp pilus assembly protein PilN
MKLSARTAVGVDISEGLITLALLKRSAKGVELVKTASGEVPDGAIANGSIEDPAALSRAIKELKKHNRMLTRRSAVSLSVSPVITRILETPQGTPRNIGQFVADELKSYVALSGREITFDFCGIKSGHGPGGRLLVVAADQKQTTELLRTHTRAGLDVEALEPALLAYTRALYAERIKGRFDCNVLLALLAGSTLTLCVFRREALDIVRVEDISAEKAEPDELCRRLAAEINTIIRSYEVEVADSAGKWEVTVLADRVQLPDEAQEFLRAETPNAALQVISGENAYADMIVQAKGCKAGRPALAISLAMGLLNARETGLRINLVPPESAEVRSVRKQLILTTVIIVLAIPLFAFLSAKGLSLLADKVHRGIETGKLTDVSQETATLMKEQNSLERQIALLSTRPDGLEAIMSSRRSLDWASILDDVKARTPKAVRITSLGNSGETGMSLEGLALSYEAARLFETKLSESDYISRASLSEATRKDSAGGLVTYTIDCSLTDKKSEN